MLPERESPLRPRALRLRADTLVQGQQVLDSYHLGRFTIGQNAGFLSAITLAFILAGYIGLRVSARPRFRFIK